MQFVLWFIIYGLGYILCVVERQFAKTVDCVTPPDFGPVSLIKNFSKFMRDILNDVIFQEAPICSNQNVKKSGTVNISGYESVRHLLVYLFGLVRESSELDKTQFWVDTENMLSMHQTNVTQEIVATTPRFTNHDQLLLRCISCQNHDLIWFGNSFTLDAVEGLKLGALQQIVALLRVDIVHGVTVSDCSVSDAHSFTLIASLLAAFIKIKAT